jgi:hypothetical protein
LRAARQIAAAMTGRGPAGPAEAGALATSAAALNVILPPDLMAAPEGPADDEDDMTLFPVNAVPAAQLRRLASQWRVAVAPKALIFLGLDYAAIGPVAQAFDIEVTPDVFAALQDMEAEAAAVLNGGGER